MSRKCTKNMFTCPDFTIGFLASLMAVPDSRQNIFKTSLLTKL